jgi:hypothetical protein
MFIGCFDKTAPLSLSPKEIYGSLENGMAFFEYWKDIRNSYAAHKYGPCRQCVVGITVDDSGSVDKVGNAARIFSGFKVEGREQAINFIRMAGHHVARKMDELKDLLLVEAKALTQAELAALKPAKTYDIMPDQVNLGRPSFKKRNDD